MKYIETEKYKITCVLEASELFSYGITFDEIVSRTPKAWMFISELKEKAKSVTDYEWPGCAYSMQIEARDNGAVALTFSETISDFVYNLRQSQSLAGADCGLDLIINEIEQSDEDRARKIIHDFEESVKSHMKA